MCHSAIVIVREILEPVLRLDEALDLGAHRARIDVVGDHEEQRVVDILLVDFCRTLRLLALSKVLRTCVEQLVHLGIAVITPVVPFGGARLHCRWRMKPVNGSCMK